jgi:pyridoxal 5'-phosphate synthase pdxS subunit
MQLGLDGVFVGSGIFKSGPDLSGKERREAWFKRAQAIVKAVTHYNDPDVLAEVSRNLGEAMVGINVSSLPEEELLATRGW